MSGPRHRRGAVSFAAMATLLMLPVSEAAGRPVAKVGPFTQRFADGLPPVPVPVPAAKPLSTGSGGCAKAHAQPAHLAARVARAALLCSINKTRAAHGLGAFGGERHLRRAADGHARDMVRYRYFAHQRAGGPSFGTRLRKAGWHGRAAGEALAWGCGKLASAAATVRAWMNSPPHREILLGGYKRAGIGVEGHAPTTCGPGATWVLDAGT